MNLIDLLKVKWCTFPCDFHLFRSLFDAMLCCVWKKIRTFHYYYNIVCADPKLIKLEIGDTNKIIFYQDNAPPHKIV